MHMKVFIQKRSSRDDIYFRTRLFVYTFFFQKKNITQSFVTNKCFLFWRLLNYRSFIVSKQELH